MPNKNTSSMTGLNLEKIRQELVERKLQLEAELKAMSQESLTDDQVQDPGDQAQSLTMEALRSSLQNQELAEYTMLGKAIDAIDAGTYGICMDCGEQISEKRLKVYPNASRCIACQEALESSR